jgi:C1A family cysteine protease
MKWFQAQGLVQTYVWARDVEELCQFVLTTGPALIGCNWHQDMFNPDSKGFIKPTGPIAGGHEFVLQGYNHKTWTLTFANSWGTSWGIKGKFRMNRTDFEALMADQGDMVAATESNVV